MSGGRGSPGNPPRYRSRLRLLGETFEGLIFGVFILLTWPVTRIWLRNWGAQPGEVSRRWPGDAFVPHPEEVLTRAVSVRAPAGAVWPWVVQFGLERAGFYSYELLERAVGIPVRNVESVVSELQSLQVGDGIQLHPSAPPIPVAAVEPGRHVCFAQVGESDGEAPAMDPLRSWSIYLGESGGQGCRLLVRTCLGAVQKPSLAKSIGLAVEAPVDFLMEQRMLRTIKRLAERPTG